MPPPITSIEDLIRQIIEGIMTRPSDAEYVEGSRARREADQRYATDRAGYQPPPTPIQPQGPAPPPYGPPQQPKWQQQQEQFIQGIMSGLGGMLPSGRAIANRGITASTRAAQQGVLNGMNGAPAAGGGTADSDAMYWAQEGMMPGSGVSPGGFNAPMQPGANPQGGFGSTYGPQAQPGQAGGPAQPRQIRSWQDMLDWAQEMTQGAAARRTAAAQIRAQASQLDPKSPTYADDYKNLMVEAENNDKEADRLDDNARMTMTEARNWQQNDVNNQRNQGLDQRQIIGDQNALNRNRWVDDYNVQAKNIENQIATGRMSFDAGMAAINRLLEAGQQRTSLANNINSNVLAAARIAMSPAEAAAWAGRPGTGGFTPTLTRYDPENQQDAVAARAAIEKALGLPIPQPPPYQALDRPGYQTQNYPGAAQAGVQSGLSGGQAGSVPGGFQPYRGAIEAAAGRHGVNPAILAAMLQQESMSFNPDVISGKINSPVGARGIAQFMDPTAKQYGVDPLNPESAIDGAARYLKDLLGMFGGDITKAIMAYNAGPGNIGKGIIPAETQTYINKVRQYAADYEPVFKQPQASGSSKPNAKPSPDVEAAVASQLGAGSVAKAKAMIGKDAFNNLCLAFVEQTSGSGWTGGSAKESWERAANKVTGLQGMQADDWVYFEPNAGNQGFGHVGIASGPNSFIGSQSKGPISEWTIDDWVRYSGAKPIGYVPRGPRLQIPPGTSTSGPYMNVPQRGSDNTAPTPMPHYNEPVTRNGYQPLSQGQEGLPDLSAARNWQPPPNFQMPDPTNWTDMARNAGMTLPDIQRPDWQPLPEFGSIDPSASRHAQEPQPDPDQERRYREWAAQAAAGMVGF